MEDGTLNLINSLHLPHSLMTSQGELKIARTLSCLEVINQQNSSMLKKVWEIITYL